MKNLNNEIYWVDEFGNEVELDVYTQIIPKRYTMKFKEEK